MRRTRLAMKATQPGIQVTSGTVADAINEQRRLTDRDRRILHLLADHQVLTTDQLTHVAFTSPVTASHRLSALAARGVLARFRRCVRPGSQPWRYTLGVLGAIMHAAEHGKPIPRPSRITEKILSIAESPRLTHLLGINEFFTKLIYAAREGDSCELIEWWPERRIGATVGKIVQPDGYGKWSENGHKIGFFLEYDNGTEPLSRLMEKLSSYERLSNAGVTRPVLFVLPSPVRESHFHVEMNRDPQLIRTMRVATATSGHLDTVTPAEAVWLAAGTNRRLRLINLTRTTSTTAPRQAA